MAEPQDNLGSLSVGYVEELLEAYLQDPASVSSDWQKYFGKLLQSDGVGSRARFRPSFQTPGLFNPRGAVAGNGQVSEDALQAARLQERVDQLVRNFRVRGHMIARIDPLGMPKPKMPELDIEYYGFTEADLNLPFSTSSIKGAKYRSLGEILWSLHNTYCRTIGVQFMHIDDLTVREWLQERMEGSENHIQLSRAEQLRILTRLTDAVIFEEFIRKKYIGAKSFSLEGGESLIPLLDLAIEKAGAQGVREIVIGMAHRGRLNVLANIIGKSPQQIFREFEDPDPELHRGGGDVKYHLGHSGDWETAAGERVHLSLCFNPSHLEFVNPVALGRTRAKQERHLDDGYEAMALLIHGDASFAGEGIVQESLNLSQLQAYTVGGTLHVIVNNQLGFTTPPTQGRSTTYATDVAKMLQIPIFHVNGEDPEAVAQVVDLALDFRKTFHRDVVIDMYCYRRWGHNEGDEPAFTQPVMYETIENRESVRDSYLDYLLDLEGLSRDEADRIAEERRQSLEEALELARSDEYAARADTLGGYWSGYEGGRESAKDEGETGADPEEIRSILESITSVPDGFHLHRKLERFLEHRREMLTGDREVDWATAEALAVATLAVNGHRVRLTGQDSERGTFSQRHATWFDAEDGTRYEVLQHLHENQGPVEICNSPLSESGVLGFEYGYSLDFPEALVCWEAQFGDFFNAAQVVFDQFIASAEDKWHRLSGIVLLLPHGFEGQGPEHSSARIERFLMLAAEDNIQVVTPSTPAQYFHVLRRQVLRRWRKPLVVITPKSLLRHPRVVSPLDDFSQGRFRRVIPDAAVQDARRVLLCGGKVYYDLLKAREQEEIDDVAIVRVEQLYPFPEEELRETIADHAGDRPVFWVQEEPENMGAWYFLKANLDPHAFGQHPLRAVTRRKSASPATGSSASHKMEQKELMERALLED